MKTGSATFEIIDRATVWVIRFQYDRDGKTTQIEVSNSHDDKPKNIPNAKGRYKACVTHCLAVIRLVTGRETQICLDNHQRAAKRKAKAPFKVIR